jgi:hypothetical protein
MDNDIEQLAGNPAGGANAMTPGGGRVLLQQTLQLQEEAMKQIGYSTLPEAYIKKLILKYSVTPIPYTASAGIQLV